MTVARKGDDRTITGNEVREWVANSRTLKLKKAQYDDIARQLTRMRWPGDAADPPGSPWNPREIEPEQDRWWDFKGATKAAKLLLASTPAMLRHWESLRWAPETADGHDAIKKVEIALAAALPFVEWPFGEPQRKSTRYKRLNSWHAYALTIARIVIAAIARGGCRKVAITRNSVVVRIVHRALLRMKHRHVTASAIGAHLTRWDKEYGLTPQGVAALTTK